MRMKPVSSSNLKSIGYELNKKLTVSFKSGSVYEYKKVPDKVYKTLMKAKSHGKYFYHNIRMDYPYKKIKAVPGKK